MEKEYITIKKFSKMAGVTYQAIYKRLDTNLKPYVKKVEGKVLLDTQALEEFYSTEVKKEKSTVQSEVEKNENPKIIIELLKTQMEITNKQIGTMNEQITVLKDQLSQKDKQIDNLHKHLEQSLKNTSEGHFVLAQHQQKSIEEYTGIEVKKPWYKRMFKK